jgi:hypothetical protein
MSNPFSRIGVFEMPTTAKLPLAILIAVAWSSMAFAGDPRCNRPPFGGSPDRYRAILENYGQKLASVTKTLEEICNMKFGGADRTALYTLGFTDEEINRLDTSALTVDVIKGVKSRPNSN